MSDEMSWLGVLVIIAWQSFALGMFFYGFVTATKDFKRWLRRRKERRREKNEHKNKPTI